MIIGRLWRNAVALEAQQMGEKENNLLKYEKKYLCTDTAVVKKKKRRSSYP